MMLVLLSLFVLATTVQSQSKYCCYPDQWEATEGVLSGSTDDEGNAAITQSLIDISFDAKEKRVHEKLTIVTGNNTKMYTVLQLYNQSVQYLIQNTTCTRAKLQPWDNENCIPNNATVRSKYRLGQNQSIMVTEYTFNIGTQQVLVTVTDDCIPIVSERFGELQGASLMLGAGLEGLTLGIKDPHIFDIPDICNKAGNVVEARPHPWIEVNRAKRSSMLFGRYV